MTNEDLKLWNEGIIKPEYVKAYTHYYCKAVEWEQKKYNLTLWQAVIKVDDKLINCSNCGGNIKAVDCPAVDCFFNQKNTIPAYVAYWLHYIYCGVVNIDEIVPDYDLYNRIQRAYVKHNRYLKSDKKEEKRILKGLRRRLCRIYKSGKYAETLKLHGKDLSEIINPEEIENAEEVLTCVFKNGLETLTDSYHEREAAYLLGIYQGKCAAAREFAEKGGVSYEK